MRRHPYDEATERELARWPGVTAEREFRGVHLALVISLGARSRSVIYAATPSDGARGLQNHLAVLRRMLKAIGAEKVRQTRREGPGRVKQARTEPKRVHWPERPQIDPSRDPWAALKAWRPRGPRRLTRAELIGDA